MPSNVVAHILHARVCPLVYVMRNSAVVLVCADVSQG